MRPKHTRLVTESQLPHHASPSPRSDSSNTTSSNSTEKVDSLVWNGAPVSPPDK